MQTPETTIDLGGFTQQAEQLEALRQETVLIPTHGLAYYTGEIPVRGKIVCEEESFEIALIARPEIDYSLRIYIDLEIIDGVIRIFGLSYRKETNNEKVHFHWNRWEGLTNGEYTPEIETDIKTYLELLYSALKQKTTHLRELRPLVDSTRVGIGQHLKTKGFSNIDHNQLIDREIQTILDQKDLTPDLVKSRISAKLGQLMGQAESLHSRDSREDTAWAKSIATQMAFLLVQGYMRSPETVNGLAQSLGNPFIKAIFRSDFLGRFEALRTISEMREMLDRLVGDQIINNQEEP